MSEESPVHGKIESPKKRLSAKKSSGSSSSQKSSRRSSHRVQSSKISRVLSELKDDIVSDPPLNLRGGDGDIQDESSMPVYGKDEIYIENHGKFIKAPKEIAIDGHFKSEPNEETWAFEVTTPLDLVITIQNLWTQLGKILLGIAAGLALTESILILLYYSSYLGDNFLDYYPVYSIFSNALESLFYILLIFSVISLFDWLDIAHINMADLMATLQYRKVWIVAFFYVIAISIMFAMSSWSDYIYLQRDKHFAKETQEVSSDDDLISSVRVWNVGNLVKDFLILIGWMCLVCFKNEDLFLIHLIEIKKYDYPYDRIIAQENHI